MCLQCVSVVRFKFPCNILINGKIIREMPGSVASGTPYTSLLRQMDRNTHAGHTCNQKCTNPSVFSY